MSEPKLSIKLVFLAGILRVLTAFKDKPKAILRVPYLLVVIILTALAVVSFSKLNLYLYLLFTSVLTSFWIILFGFFFIVVHQYAVKFEEWKIKKNRKTLIMGNYLDGVVISVVFVILTTFLYLYFGGDKSASHSNIIIPPIDRLLIYLSYPIMMAYSYISFSLSVLYVFQIKNLDEKGSPPLTIKLSLKNIKWLAIVSALNLIFIIIVTTYSNMVTNQFPYLQIHTWLFLTIFESGIVLVVIWLRCLEKRLLLRDISSEQQF